MKATRVYSDMPHGWFNGPLKPGEYVKVQPTAMQDGTPLADWLKNHYPTWLACTPNGHVGNVSEHAITEHEDGTITVSPSILIRDGEGKELWHGWLERGVWRSC